MTPQSSLDLVKRKRRLKRALVTGLISFGASFVISGQTPSEAQDAPKRVNRMIEVLSKGGNALTTDTWQFVDFEHNPFDQNVIRRTIHKLLDDKNADGVPKNAPVVRITSYGYELAGNRWMIRQTLESGAMGIISPKIDNAEEAMILIKSMRFPQAKESKYHEPNGERGGSGPGKDWGLADPRGYVAAADLWPLNPQGELLAFPMIESVEGFKNLSSILDVPGVTGVVVGPTDFAATHGYTFGGTEHPDVQAMYKKIADTCNAKKKYCGMLATTPELEARYLKMGYKIIMRTIYGPAS